MFSSNNIYRLVLPLLLLIQLLVVGMLFSCVSANDVGELGNGTVKTASENSSAQLVGEAKYSALAFLDKSIPFTKKSEVFTTEGRIAKSAYFYPDTDSLLIFITNSAIDVGKEVIFGGEIVLYSLKGSERTFGLKGELDVIGARSSVNSREVYLSAVEKTTRTIGNGRQESGATATLGVQPYLLEENGKLIRMSLTNIFITAVVGRDKLVARQVKHVNRKGAGYELEFGSYLLIDSTSHKPLVRFDFEPQLSADASFALHIEQNYDPSNYENSFFSVSYLDLTSNGKTMDEFREKTLYRTGFFLTLEEQRWNPQAVILNGNRILLTTFEPARATDEVIPNASGKVNLEIIDVKRKGFQRRTIMEDVSPYIWLYPMQNEPVFFMVWKANSAGSKRVYLDAVSIDGKHIRRIYESAEAELLEVADFDVSKGSIVLIEHIKGANPYSSVIVLSLSEESDNVESGSSETSVASESGEELGETPPKIRVPSVVS